MSSVLWQSGKVTLGIESDERLSGFITDLIESVRRVLLRERSVGVKILWLFLYLGSTSVEIIIKLKTYEKY